MNSERSRASIAPSRSSRSNSDSLYMVFKITGNGLVEMSSMTQSSGDTQSSSLAQNAHQPASPPGMMRNTFRHPKPCGECSAKKVKCTPIPSNPVLCVRCNSRGYAQCPPHVPWSARRANPDTRSVTRDFQDAVSATMNHQHSRVNSVSSTSTQPEYAPTPYGFYTPESTFHPSSYASGSDLTSGTIRTDYGPEATGAYMIYATEPASYHPDEATMQSFYPAGPSSAALEQSSFPSIHGIYSAGLSSAFTSFPSMHEALSQPSENDYDFFSPKDH